MANLTDFLFSVFFFNMFQVLIHKCYYGKKSLLKYKDIFSSWFD